MHRTVQFAEARVAASLADRPRIEFYSARDGRRLVSRVWHSATTPQARVVFLHGITSHGGWYDQVAKHLANTGFDVHFLDRRGSGLNPLAPGDVDDWHTWLDDVAAYLDSGLNADSAQISPRNIPTVLGGISWGGKLAAAVARRHAALVDALALVCPGLYSPFSPRPFKRSVLAMRAPQRLRQRLLRVPLRQARLFTDTPRWQKFIDRDPLALRQVTWQFAKEDQRLTRFARGSAPFLHLPLLLMLAGTDQIVDNNRTRHFFGQSPAKHKTLIEYGGAGHTLEFEHDPSGYFADLADWIGRVAACNEE